ncbi:hypothetical protein FQA39_LY04521 [Lamprigera yunnana]|nr:hypothetical protein FQA39_LY04521 [Lamprigera yunnana]
MAGNNGNKPFKSEMLNRSPSTQQIRDSIRNHFRRNIKEVRYREMCQRRQLLQNVPSDVSFLYSNIRRELCHDLQEVTPEEMLTIMYEIDLELSSNSQSIVEQQTVDRAYTNEIVCFCPICNKSVVGQNLSNVICDNCANLYFADDM